MVSEIRSRNISKDDFDFDSDCNTLHKKYPDLNLLWDKEIIITQMPRYKKTTTKTKAPTTNLI